MVYHHVLECINTCNVVWLYRTPICNFLYCCFMYFASACCAETFREIKHCQSMPRTALKRQYRFETRFPPLYISSSVMIEYSLTGLLDMTLCVSHCRRVSSLYIYGCGARAFFISYMVPHAVTVLILSPENKPQLALNAKVMYNGRSLSTCRSKF